MFGPGSCQGPETNSHQKKKSHKVFSPNSLVLSDTFVYSNQMAVPGSSNKLAPTGQGRLNTARKQRDYSYRKRREAVVRRSSAGGESGSRRIPNRRMRDVLHPYRESPSKTESPSLISRQADQGRINYSFSMGDLSTSSSFNTFKIPGDNKTPSGTGTAKSKFVFIDHEVQLVSKDGKLGITNNDDSSLDSFDSVDF